jgi:hypothetical protein
MPMNNHCCQDTLIRKYSNTHEASLKNREASNRVEDFVHDDDEDGELPPGSKAFVECDREAIIDLFYKFAVNCDVSGKFLDKERLGDLLRTVGENPDQITIDRLFSVADINGDGVIELDVSLFMIQKHFTIELKHLWCNDTKFHPCFVP